MITLNDLQHFAVSFPTQLKLMLIASCRVGLAFARINYSLTFDRVAPLLRLERRGGLIQIINYYYPLKTLYSLARFSLIGHLTILLYIAFSER